ncbi:MAG TPA: 1-deoxy-D-xylulose-5-phosphate reductoisomerase [Pyrinomonadaceae bacterium]|jgi:1-deoxy-D-xylulose-5-phosphate reductoisomerase|nr:1-deoxy-D-xylulose-5-phosphate reductoisomerase [Pyrinomonadaceae bacterium]
MAKKGISILGSTGSIGCNTLKVIEFLREPEFRVVAMGAGENIGKLAEQIARFQPELVSVKNEDCAEKLLATLFELDAKPPRIELGEAGLIAVATHEQAETVVSATVGAVGFVPTLRAIEAGKRIALANKETLVMAGELMTAAAVKSGAEILPVDSEHNALHQCLRGEKKSEVKRLVLTASGGPFRTKTREEIAAATVSEALDHPTWNMGDKITIDSATLMNKGLEVIEAYWLFGYGAEQIDVVVHPQSVIHSMVELMDGSVIAQMGVTDMKHAIQYALTYPDRKPNCTPQLDIAKLSQLTFEEPDLERFPCLGLAYRALKTGGTMPVALNAANEVAVEAFLKGNIKLNEIAQTIESVLDGHRSGPADSLEAVLAADNSARTHARELFTAKTSPAGLYN